MEINKEPLAKYSIISYDDSSITVQATQYKSSLIVSKNQIDTNWKIQKISELDINNIQPLLSVNPEIIIIGHSLEEEQVPINVRAFLAKERIGIESMSVGAACRTFNILLNENRNVVFGYIP